MVSRPISRSYPVPLVARDKNEYVIEMTTYNALNTLASMGIKAGAAVAPSRELDIFPHRMYAKGRLRWYLDASLAAPG